ncbi:folate-binding protein [Alisedimentitalea sp. MJ-SS2]|uniref:CAF17-like 4Fe-4S cluster assembly/insertion protein YgfZ n=1 Tax=Aliisedimentitalea sp. MJ-SS2 TaxID=3049795 RepID=UPI0029155C93|nr:folate-binding protein [Alisedimentitalea sp. MJ-SS2]MDU8928405.1 folate-binding protein [Alisedimentitalea sp. MJ-SS2]
MTRAIYRITGADRESFLQGLVSNDVKNLSDGLVYAALLTPQGKYLADFFLVPAGDAILLDIDARIAAPTITRLSMYKLRADVEIEETALQVRCGIGDRPVGAFSDPRHAALGWRAYHEAGTSGSEEQPDWDAIRVENIIPETGAELTPDTFILEAGFERLNGVDFRKGCYVGQEVTARMKHKTELRKGLGRIHLSAPVAPGTELTSKGKPAGTVHTVSGNKAIAYLRFDRADNELMAGDVTAHWDKDALA